MFNLDDKVRTQISRLLERALVVDPNSVTCRLLGELLKELGVHQRLQATTTRRALDIAAEWQPQLIFVEFSGPALDGVDFTNSLRRSRLPVRKAAVIFITADTRETSIKAARDAGAHEFLGKPFTAGHVFRRVENVILKPRPWVEADYYVGPDRRRFNSGQYDGERKRGADGEIRPSPVMEDAEADKTFII